MTQPNLSMGEYRWKLKALSGEKIDRITKPSNRWLMRLFGVIF